MSGNSCMRWDAYDWHVAMLILWLIGNWSFAPLLVMLRAVVASVMCLLQTSTNTIK